MKRSLSALALALAVPSAGQAQPTSTDASPPAAPVPSYAPYGLDLAGRDLSVRPGDDFSRHANGHWFDTQTIPADRAEVGSFDDIYETTQTRLRDLITKAPTDHGIGLLYASFMDEGRVEAVGDAPLRAALARIDALPDKIAFARAMGESMGGFGTSVIDVGIAPDTADARKNVLWLGQAGLGLPDRDYYLTAQFKPQRDAYVAYIARTFRMLGHADAAGDAAKVMAFEQAIADKSWPVADRRDIEKTNNPLSTAQLSAYAPGLDWTALLAGAGIAPQTRSIVQEKTAIRDIAAIYGATPLATLKLWQQFHTASGAAGFLPKAWVDSRFAFVRTLSGVDAQLPRWKRGVMLLDESLGELVGQAYVAAYFPPVAKAKMEALVANLKAAMADRIRSNTWMAAATKVAALDKLSRMRVMVGYPDKFRDYSGLRLTPGDLYGNVERALRFNYAYQLADLGKPVDQAKWAMNPQTVNAYNGGAENKIVFPAAILSAPFFDVNADDAVNYGGIGAVIGHEISHGFDDQGRKFDASGTVRDWWAPGDGARFDARAKVLGDQFATYQPVPGVFVNPSLTMGENIADLAGLLVSHDAYLRSLHGRPAPVRDGLTGEQRFFYAFSQDWREKQRPDAMRQQLASDPHSPGVYRLIGATRNVDAWYAAFGVKPGNKMYLAPGARARIW